MAVQLRETQLGGLLRLLSGNRLLQYPDELDPGLAKTFQRDSINPQTDLKAIEQNEEPVKGNDGAEDRNDVCLIGWYGPNDPEVYFLLQ